MSKHMLGIIGVTLAVLIGSATGLSVARTYAQTPPPSGPGGPVVWTDKQQYVVGEQAQVCVQIPGPGTITLTVLLPGGGSQVAFSGPVTAPAACQFVNVAGPAGNTCIRLDYQGTSTLSTQTCVQVITTALPPASTGLSIYTNVGTYHVGDPITACYTVPTPGTVGIVHTGADGQRTTLVSTFDDGTGGCAKATVQGPPGVACLTLSWQGVAVVPGVIITGSPASTETCYQILGTTSTAPPAAFTVLGSAPVPASGIWEFHLTATVSTTATLIRVSSAGCDASPSSAFVWEAALQRPTQTVVYGFDVLAGYLLPVGLSASSPNSGYAVIAHPLTGTVTSAVDLIISSIPQYVGINLTACVR